MQFGKKKPNRRKGLRAICIHEKKPKNFRIITKMYTCVDKLV